MITTGTQPKHGLLRRKNNIRKRGINNMKKLRKKICLLLSVSMLVCMNDISVLATATQSDDIITRQENVITPDESSGFDENAHGEVLQEGTCGENANYKLYEDKTLYIYGKGTMSSPLSEETKKDVLNVYIDKGITESEELSLSGYEKMENVEIPDTMSVISYAMFEKCSNLTKIQLPNSITKIEDSAFYECKKLKKIIIPTRVTSIGHGMFSGCTELEEIVLPDEIVLIGTYAFDRCACLKEIKIPDTVTSIGQGAFSECKSMDEILIPDNVEDIGLFAFRDCNIKIKCNSGTVAEKYAKDNGIEFELLDTNKPERPIVPDVEIKNTFNGCKRSSVKLSITCKESDEFTFECLDNCGMKSKYAGYSSIQVGGFSSYSKNYELLFEKSGEHVISAYKNGNLMEYDKIIISENHTWDSGKIDKKETCKENGIKKFTCSNCENTKTEIIPATGHNYIKTITRKAACTSNGTEKYTCSECNDSYSKAVPKTGHIIGNWKVSKKPTIFKAGKEEILCTVCKKTLQERDIKKLKASVKISKTKLKLKKGKIHQLKIKKKSNGDKVSKWTTSNKRIVSVNRKTGKIKALKKGRAKITVKMKSGCKAICNVTVK